MKYLFEAEQLEMWDDFRRQLTDTLKIDHKCSQFITIYFGEHFWQDWQRIITNVNLILCNKFSDFITDVIGEFSITDYAQGFALDSQVTLGEVSVFAGLNHKFRLLIIFTFNSFLLPFFLSRFSQWDFSNDETDAAMLDVASEIVNHILGNSMSEFPFISPNTCYLIPFTLYTPNVILNFDDSLVSSCEIQIKESPLRIIVAGG